MNLLLVQQTRKNSVVCCVRRLVLSAVRQALIALVACRVSRVQTLRARRVREICTGTTAIRRR